MLNGKKNCKCCCKIYDKEGLQLFPGKKLVFDYLWQECGNNKIRHARQARLRAAVLQSRNPLVSLCFCFCFFFNGCRNCKCIFCLSFLIPQNGTYPYLFKYKFNCRPTPKKKRLFREAKHTAKHLWLMYSRLQLLKNLPVNHPILSQVRVFLLNKCLRKIQRPAHQPHLRAGQLQRSLVCPISMLRAI